MSSRKNKRKEKSDAPTTFKAVAYLGEEFCNKNTWPRSNLERQCSVDGDGPPRREKKKGNAPRAQKSRDHLGPDRDRAVPRG